MKRNHFCFVFFIGTFSKYQRKTLFEKIGNIKRSLLNQNYSIIVETPLFGSSGLNDEENEKKKKKIALNIRCYLLDLDFVSTFKYSHIVRTYSSSFRLLDVWSK